MGCSHVRPVKSVRAAGDGVGIKNHWIIWVGRDLQRLSVPTPKGWKVEEGVNEAETFPGRKHSSHVLAWAGRMWLCPPPGKGSFEIKLELQKCIHILATKQTTQAASHFHTEMMPLVSALILLPWKLVCCYNWEKVEENMFSFALPSLCIQQLWVQFSPVSLVAF